MNRLLKQIITVSLLPVTAGSSYPLPAYADLGGIQEEVETVGTMPEVGSVEHCAGILFGDVGREGRSGEGDSEPSVARLSQSRGRTIPMLPQDVEFVKLVYAVIHVESRGNPLAVSPKEAVGLMQLTAPAVIDAAKHCNLTSRPIPTPEHLFDVKTNIQYGSCYLRKLLSETDGDIVRALVAYNGGYKALTVYDREGNLNQETANYVLKVNQALRKCTTQKLIN